MRKIRAALSEGILPAIPGTCARSKFPERAHPAIGFHPPEESAPAIVCPRLHTATPGGLTQFHLVRILENSSTPDSASSHHAETRRARVWIPLPRFRVSELARRTCESPALQDLAATIRHSHVGSRSCADYLSAPGHRALQLICRSRQTILLVDNCASSLPEFSTA